jgi:LysM repeat protein
MNKKWLYAGIAVLLLVAVVFTAYFALQTDSSSTTTEYIVKEGDSCKKIADDHNISVESLVEINPKLADCGSLMVDQKLIIPAP